MRRSKLVSLDFFVQRQREELFKRVLRAHFRKNLGRAIELADEAASFDFGEFFQPSLEELASPATAT